MQFDADSLSSALGTIAEQDAPPSGVDADRARVDGRRTLRRRRTAAGLGGTGAVALVAALALSAGHVFGGAPGTGAAATRQVVRTADWDPLVAPGTFGWLPANAPNVNYLIAPGPGQGSQALGKGSEVFADCHRVLHETGGAVVERARAAGVVRDDLDQRDLLWMAHGVSMAAESEGGAARVERLLGVLVAGMTA